MVEELSARSVALSILLGARPPQLTARDLTSLGSLFGISSATMRVALSRMVAAGDLTADEGVYTLSARHLERQKTTESLIHPRLRPYDGMWRMVVVVDRGRSAPDRAALRAHLTQARLAVLREGVWLRPDNLQPELDTEAGLARFETVPQDDRELTQQLWDLPAWAAEARRLLRALGIPGRPIDRLTVAAAAVRHLCTDPALPQELAPERWPADELRWAYEDYRDELTNTHLAKENVREDA